MNKFLDFIFGFYSVCSFGLYLFFFIPLIFWPLSHTLNIIILYYGICYISSIYTYIEILRSHLYWMCACVGLTERSSSKLNREKKNFVECNLREYPKFLLRFLFLFSSFYYISFFFSSSSCFLVYFKRPSHEPKCNLTLCGQKNFVVLSYFYICSPHTTF